ncbi:MAG: DUF1579 family protein [Phycisphaerales bacterium]
MKGKWTWAAGAACIGIGGWIVGRSADPAFCGAWLDAARVAQAAQAPNPPGVPALPAPPGGPVRPEVPPAGAPDRQPEPERRMLGESAGVYDVEMSVYLEPGAEPVKIKAKATREMILGGRFLLERLQSTDPERPYASMCVIGFNPDALEGARLEIVRYNTMSASTMPEAGKWDEQTRTLMSRGEHENAGMFTRVRTVEHHESRDRFTVEVHAAFEGYSLEFKGMKLPEYRTMALEYRRVEP